MLGKLLKYDLRYVYKVLGAYYIFTIFAVICGILLQQIPEPPFIIEFLAEFLTNAGIGLSVGIIINAFTRTWVRFRQNLYGDESYLTHTLPISRLQLFASKFISAIIILLISLALIAIVIVLVLYTNGVDIFDGFFTVIPDTNFSLFHVAIVLLTLLIVQSIFIIMSGFTGIILGHRFNSSRGLASWLIGVGCYLIVSFILLGLVFLLGNFNPELSSLVTSGYQPNLPTLLDLSWICSAVYTVATAAMFYINVRALNHGVNVE